MTTEDVVVASGAVTLALAHLWLLPVRPRAARTLRRALRTGARSIGRASGTGAILLRRVGSARSVQLLARGLAIGLIWSFTLWRLVTRGDQVTVLGINDYPLHIESARSLSLLPLHLNVPEFLFHLAARGGQVVVGPRLGPVAALVGFIAITYMSLVVLMREPSRHEAQVLPRRTAELVAAGYFFLESPVLILLTIHALSPTTPFFAVHWWGNPTFVASLPFTFLALPLISRAIESSELGTERWVSLRDRCTLALVVVLGTLAKPTFTLVLLPALPIYLIAVRRCTAVTFWRLARSAVAPVAAVVLWQTWFLGSGQSGEFRSGWTIEFFVEPIFGWHRMGPAFWSPLVLVLLAAWSSAGRFLRERSVQLVLVALGVALPLMLTVRETGDKAGVGNMAVPTQACVSVLLVLALRTIAWEAVALYHRPSDRSRVRPLWVWTTGAVVVAMLVAGGLSLLDGSGLLDVPADWELQYQGT